MPATLSIIIPTLRERENLAELAERLKRALAGVDYEIIIVDDNSRDGTIELCAELAKSHPIRVLVREVPVDGLGGAVLLGLREAGGDVLLVMDADLQHPPESVPALLAAIDAGADFVVGSRIATGGGIDERWPLHRRLASSFAGALARPFNAGVRDIMSGFFALRRETFERGQYLAPLGFKIGLELLCKCQPEKVVEVPFTFGVRGRGESKLDLREKLRFLEHVSRLYDFRFPRLVPAIKFVIVTLLAWTAGFLAALALNRLTLDPRVTIPLAYAAAAGVVAGFHARYVRAQRPHLIRPTPWRDFMMSSAVEIVVAAGVSAYLFARVAEPVFWEIVAIAFAAATAVRYVLRKELLLDIRGLQFIPESPAVRGRRPS